MKKLFVLFTVISAVLCFCCIGCGSLGKNDGNTGGNEDAVRLEDLSIGAETFTFTYDGEPKFFDVKLFDRNNKLVTTVKVGEDHPDLEAIFTDNVEIGKGSVTVVAKDGSKKFVGSVSTGINIVPSGGSVSVKDFQALKQYAAGGVYAYISLDADVEIPDGESVTIYPTTTLTVRQFVLSNRGELINNGTVNISSRFDNYGIYDNNGDTVLNETAYILNKGIIEDSGVFKNPGFRDSYIYTDGTVVFANERRNIVVFVRKSIENSEFGLIRDSFVYNGKPCTVELGDLSSDEPVVISAGEYDVSYADNVNAGKTTATVTAKELSRTLYGQRTFEFEIERAEINAEYSEQFESALKNRNYATVNLIKRLAGTVDVVTLPDVTVNITADGVSVRKIILAPGSTLYLNGKIFIYGDISVGYAEEGYKKIELASGSQLVISNRITMSGNVTGTGEIIVNEGGELYFDSNAVKPTTQIINSGGVYADFDVSDVTGDGEAITRRHLTVDEITVERTEYTGKDLDVKATFEYSVDASYRTSYWFDGAFTTNKRPRERGDYRAELSFYSTDKHYCGTVEFNFTVYRGAVEVADFSALKKAMETGNYDRFTIPQLVIAESFTVESDLSIFVTYTLTNNGNITVKGTLSANNIVNNAGKTLTVAAGGTVTAEKNFYNMDLSSLLIFEGDGVFRNNGAAYLCDTDDPNISGVKYIRTADLASATFSDVTTAVYGVNTEPTFSLSMNDVALDVSAFDIAYDGNAGRTNGATATVNVYARRDDKTYYGHATHNYEVLPGKVLVKYESELLAALDNCNGELCNWGEIETSARILLSEPSKGIKSLRVRKGTTLIVKYDIEYWDAVPDKNKFAFANDGTIEFHNGARIKDVYLWRSGGNGGIFKLFVCDKSDFKYGYGEYYEYIELQTNISIESKDNMSVNAKYGDITVNLNGFNITGGKSGGKLSIYCNGKTVNIYGPGNLTAIVSVPDTTGNTEGAVLLHSVSYYMVEDPNGLVDYYNSYPNA